MLQRKNCDSRAEKVKRFLAETFFIIMIGTTFVLMSIKNEARDASPHAFSVSQVAGYEATQRLHREPIWIFRSTLGGWARANGGTR